ncbi:hypothetical protein EDD94_7322 [Streptomyces sp. PanSC9]|nr:hypothetical protein EDD94_7322 [Streptomyces sp. PanSC9]
MTSPSQPRRNGQPHTVGMGRGELENEVTQLRHAVSSHAAIDRAIGVLISVDTPTPSWCRWPPRAR